MGSVSLYTEERAILLVGTRSREKQARHQRTLFIQLIYSCFSRDLVPTNSVALSSVYKAYTTHNSSICSDEGLTLETSAFHSLYGGQFTLSTPLINQIFVLIFVIITPIKGHLRFLVCTRFRLLLVTINIPEILSTLVHGFIGRNLTFCFPCRVQSMSPRACRTVPYTRSSPNF